MDTGPRRLTSPRLWRIFVLASIIGTVLPVLAVVQKTADGRTSVDQILKTSDPVSRLVERPLAGALVWLGRTVGLEDASWHNPRARTHNRYYLRYAVMNALAVVALLLWRRRAERVIDQALGWMRRPDHRGPRRLIFTAAVLMILTYQLKLMWGFWLPGLAGWHYLDRVDRLSPEPPALAEGFRPPTDRERAFLGQALFPEHARYLPHDGWITGRAMMLHYGANGADGTEEVLPANLELVELVFYRYVHGAVHRPDERTDARQFAAAVRRTLTDRHAGRQCLMPLRFAYPNHCYYMPLPYETYPSPERLERITFWEMVLEVRVAGELRIVFVNETNAFEVPPAAGAVTGG